MADAGFHVVPMQAVALPFTLPRAQIEEAKAANDERKNAQQAKAASKHTNSACCAGP